MNQESGKWEDFDEAFAKEWIDKNYPNEVESDIPVFKKGEVISIRGYNWRVHGIHEGGSRLILRALRRSDD
jgi:hypothetical protein